MMAARFAREGAQVSQPGNQGCGSGSALIFPPGSGRKKLKVSTEKMQRKSYERLPNFLDIPTPFKFT